jgi:hypothetical protein
MSRRYYRGPGLWEKIIGGLVAAVILGLIVLVRKWLGLPY